jgi:hypothetical protein
LKKYFPYLIALSAISISFSAAFYSISGLSKLFAGASTAVMILGSSLEFSKLVIASLLYQYWDDINKALRAYLTTATLVLILITSMGIYGFLSGAYQEVYQKTSIHDNEISYLQQKENYYSQNVARYDLELDRISKNISTLSTSKATQIQVKDKNSENGLRTSVSTAELRMASKRIEVEEKNRVEVENKRNISSDSLQVYQNKILIKKNDSEVVGELGPLKYLTELTGIAMNKIINVLLLVIIFVFDPLAIALVIAANYAFSLGPKVRHHKPIFISEKVDDIEEILNSPHPTPPIEEYDPTFDILSIKQRLKNTALSSWRRRKLEEQLEKIQSSKH